MKIVLVDQSAADRKYYRILLSQAPLSQISHPLDPIPSGPIRGGHPSPGTLNAGVGNILHLRGSGSRENPRSRAPARPSATTSSPAIALHAPIEFFEASQGIQALELCRKISPDCILLDYKLPDMDGLEFLDRFRAAATPADDPSCAVVMLTSVASEQMAVMALRAGAQDYLVKDRVSAESLTLAIEKATQKVSLIRQLRSERDRLAQSLSEKELLIQEVHHRVKNNLQVIGSLLHLQAESLAESVIAAGASKALRDAQHRVEAMAVVHDQLYESGVANGGDQAGYAWSSSPEGPQSLDLERHANLLLANLFLAYGVEGEHITRHVAVQRAEGGGPGAILNPDQAIPVGLILNELVSNALKHAFPDNRQGRIEIEARCDMDGILQLSVRDNGVGMAEGFDVQHTKTLGLKIVHVLTRQLKGSVTLDHAEGTTFHIRFPYVSRQYPAAQAVPPEKEAEAVKMRPQPQGAPRSSAHSAEQLTTDPKDDNKPRNRQRLAYRAGAGG